jgi:hypothetical protein
MCDMHWIWYQVRNNIGLYRTAINTGASTVRRIIETIGQFQKADTIALLAFVFIASIQKKCNKLTFPRLSQQSLRTLPSSGRPGPVVSQIFSKFKGNPLPPSSGIFSGILKTHFYCHIWITRRSETSIPAGTDRRSRKLRKQHSAVNQ